MKFKALTIISCLAVLLISSASKPVQKNQLIGKWQLISSLINEKSAPPMLMNRTMEFDETNHFHGRIKINGNERPYNGGKYFVANDSTLLTINQHSNGKLAPHSFTYNYKIEGDSLHLYGYYYQPVPSVKGILKTMYNDEMWVRIEE